MAGKTKKVNEYRKYWKVTLKFPDGFKEVSNRVESLDRFLKGLNRDVKFEIERLSKEEYEETE